MTALRFVTFFAPDFSDFSVFRFCRLIRVNQVLLNSFYCRRAGFRREIPKQALRFATLLDRIYRIVEKPKDLWLELTTSFFILSILLILSKEFLLSKKRNWKLVCHCQNFRSRTRYWIASERCSALISAEPSRSAIVRLTLMMRS